MTQCTTCFMFDKLFLILISGMMLWCTLFNLANFTSKLKNLYYSMFFLWFVTEIVWHIKSIQKWDEYKRLSLDPWNKMLFFSDFTSICQNLSKILQNNALILIRITCKYFEILDGIYWVNFVLNRLLCDTMLAALRSCAQVSRFS